MDGMEQDGRDGMGCTAGFFLRRGKACEAVAPESSKLVHPERRNCSTSSSPLGPVSVPTLVCLEMPCGGAHASLCHVRILSDFAHSHWQAGASPGRRNRRDRVRKDGNYAFYLLTSRPRQLRE